MPASVDATTPDPERPSARRTPVKSSRVAIWSASRRITSSGVIVRQSGWLRAPASRASFEDAETVVAVAADLRLAMTDSPRDPDRCLGFVAVRGPGIVEESSRRPRVRRRTRRAGRRRTQDRPRIRTRAASLASPTHRHDLTRHHHPHHIVQRSSAEALHILCIIPPGTDTRAHAPPSSRRSQMQSLAGLSPRRCRRTDRAGLQRLPQICLMAAAAGVGLRLVASSGSGRLTLEQPGARLSG
jgi:hypothetical protein